MNPEHVRCARRSRSCTWAAGTALLVATIGCSPGERAPSAPDFEVIAYQGADTLGGDRVSISAVFARHPRPIVLNFWAAQCPPCRAEMPDFQRIHEAYRDRLLVLGIDVGLFTGLGTEAGARQLLEQLRITYPVGAAGSASVVTDYRVLGLPVTYFLLPGGAIHGSWTGWLDGKKLDELVADLLEAADS